MYESVYVLESLIYLEFATFSSERILSDVFAPSSVSQCSIKPQMPTHFCVSGAKSPLILFMSCTLPTLQSGFNSENFMFFYRAPVPLSKNLGIPISSLYINCKCGSIFLCCSQLS